ncbi:uncharacterized protein LOC130896261 [Diorhabda carinulata]|nr:uncharacterized protein LOC130896261 [Diorhabda carinulata]
MWPLVHGCVVLFFAVRINSVHSVKCYSCLAEYNYEDCAKPKLDQISLVKCDMTALKQTRDYARHIDQSYHKLFEVDSIESEPGRIGMACLKMMTKVGNKDYFLRGCQLAEQGNLDICNKIQEHNSGFVKTVYCSKCSSEGCNSSTRYGTNLISVLYSVFITTLTYKIIDFHI